MHGSRNKGAGLSEFAENFTNTHESTALWLCVHGGQFILHFPTGFGRDHEDHKGRNKEAIRAFQKRLSCRAQKERDEWVEASTAAEEKVEPST